MTSTYSAVRPSDLSRELAELAAQPGEVTAFRLWKAITDDDRALAARMLWEADDRRPLAEVLARAFNFREQTVLSWEAEKAAFYTAKLRPHHPGVLHRLLVRLHIPGRADLLTDFLDLLGLPHDEYGELTKEAREYRVDSEKMRRACDRIVGKYPTDQVITYLLTLVIREDEFTPGLSSVRS